MATIDRTPTHDGNPPPQEGPIRVVLVDDHALMRRSLRLLLDGEDGVEVVAEADDLASALREVRAWKPDVLVLDLRLPGDPGNAAIATLHERAPAVQIVVATMHESPIYAQHALACGALGFVHKELADSELAQAVRAAARGDRYVSPSVAGRLELHTASSLTSS